MLGLPGPQISLDQALGLVRQAVAAAARGDGVVITTGTDTLEELAMLCALTHAGEAPIVFTGANRPASAPGADGPANLLDAVALAASPQAAGLGAVVVFGGEIQAAASARKFDSTGPARSARRWRVRSGGSSRDACGCTPVRCATPPSIPPRLTAPSPSSPPRWATTAVCCAPRPSAPTAWWWRRSAPATSRRACWTRCATPSTRIPVVITVAPERGSMLHATYGFEGSERDVRASGAVCTPVPRRPRCAHRAAVLPGRRARSRRDRSGARAWDA